METLAFNQQGKYMSHYAQIETEINGNVELVEVFFSLYGDYRPQTFMEPAEYPEIEINEVVFNGIDIFDQLGESELEDIDSKCWELEEYF